MVRQAVVRLVHPDLRIGAVVQVAGHHESEDARDVGLERQCHQVEHEADVCFEDLGGADGRFGNLQVGSGLLLGSYDAPLDLAHVVQVVAQPRLVTRPETLLEPRGRLRHRIQDAAASAHALEPFVHRAGTAKHALEHDARVDLHRQRRRRALPGNGVHVGAAVAHVAGADEIQ